MKNKYNNAQKVILFVVFVLLALVIMLVLDYKGIHLSFWKRLLFIVVPILVILDFVTGRIIRDRLDE